MDAFAVEALLKDGEKLFEGEREACQVGRIAYALSKPPAGRYRCGSYKAFQLVRRNPMAITLADGPLITTINLRTGKTMSIHKDHHFSITVYTPDLAILYCLRALADYSQETGNTRITWGGTKEEDWERDKQCVTFRFSEPTYRDKFVKEATRVLSNGSWSKVKESDNDPAIPRT